MTRIDRRHAIAAFTRGRCLVLLATDAAGEGLNLHARCRVVINLELPWNFVRLEQRIGRVDRIGQPRTVHAFHLIGTDTGEARLLDRLERHIATADRAVGVTGPFRSTREAALHVEPVELAEPLEPVEPVEPLLSDLARSEALRLSLVRRLRTDARSAWPSGAAPTGPLITFARGATRAMLRGDVLVVLASQVEDANGWIVASHLTPLVVQLFDNAKRQFDMSGEESLTTFARVVEEVYGQVNDAARSVWERDTVEAARALWSRRLRREQAVAADAARTERSIVQPGLFDRRVAARLEDASREGADRTIDARRRIDQATRALQTSVSRAHVSLVLWA
jgi:hypothetical protein